ncbi:uncharacterized protein LOC100163805 isoform X1 [Acyrthosiphon pisum]|uniref:Uncharacterized protein n=1 Tax=Acyrthosiphon pisum TaxID=7029 RepID=A0A8R2A676_ACYPI|nr:uncharacterized protein LOC100163805 isoform X1 [Acyrthosiphon pisum]|eukprot:XP_001951598.2 PREDICTED: uncharacterized protein LOC100163805 isoform X3 [Acyrthosiphon pisum]
MASKKSLNLAKAKDELVDGVYIRPSKKKIMTSQIVTNDELTNLIQERLANRRTGERTEFANQLARKLIKKLHDQDVKLRKTNGKKRGGLATQIIDEKTDHLNTKRVEEKGLPGSDLIDDFAADNTPPPKKRDPPKMTCKEMAMTIINCKKVLEDKTTLDKKVANKFTCALKSRLAYKLKKKPNTSSK